jgi:hypothetical protein
MYRLVHQRIHSDVVGLHESEATMARFALASGKRNGGGE